MNSDRIIFLFGAGASYGCGAVRPSPPPLGADLIGAMATYDRGFLREFDDDLRRKFVPDFEAGMAALFERDPRKADRLLTYMGYYFSQFFSPAYDTAYDDLIRKLRPIWNDKDITFASLNYDLILDESLITLNHSGMLTFAYSFGRPEPATIQLLKPHGSCNFKLMNTGHLSAEQANVISAIQPMTRSLTLEYYSGGTPVHPAVMSFYMPGKNAPLGQRCLNEIQRQLADEIVTAQHIFVVGIQPNLNDHHLWGPLSITSAKVHFCGSASAFAAWRDGYRGSRPASFIGERFFESIDAMIAIATSTE